EREKILGRVREALSIKGARPGHAISQSLEPGGSGGARRWLPRAGEDFDSRLALFEKNSAALKTVFCLLRNETELETQLKELRDREGWKKIGAHTGELTGRAARALGLPVCSTDSSYAVRELEACSAGITECDALIAQTGSVLITSASAGGRALSALPPHHVVLARRQQLIADLPDAFALLKQRYENNYPSFISLVTGPSRTGDIERILVLGAHGPKSLTIFCL
ncbi:MAG TPA: lactate utilization protein, partial [Verrucomicrobiae bacterium]|nr:lactate utilization protein [Verrucomicrobiae bacterium]